MIVDGTARLRVAELNMHDSVLRDRLTDDLAFRRGWRKTTLARALALRLLVYRSSHGLTQHELAAQLGVSVGRIGRAEMGERLPSLATIVALAQALRFELAISARPRRRAARLLDARGAVGVVEAKDARSTLLVALRWDAAARLADRPDEVEAAEYASAERSDSQSETEDY